MLTPQGQYAQPQYAQPQQQYVQPQQQYAQPSQRPDDGYIYPADGSSNAARYPSPRGAGRRLYDAQSYPQPQQYDNRGYAPQYAPQQQPYYQPRGFYQLGDSTARSLPESTGPNEKSLIQSSWIRLFVDR